jgi:hypothetical protein
MKWEVKGGKGIAKRIGVRQGKTVACRRNKALGEVV